MVIHNHLVNKTLFANVGHFCDHKYTVIGLFTLNAIPIPLGTDIRTASIAFVSFVTSSLF